MANLHRVRGAVVAFWIDAGQPARSRRRLLGDQWGGHATNPNFATFNGSMSGVRVVAVLESLGGGWAQIVG